jgi:hypothetical protein
MARTRVARRQEAVLSTADARRLRALELTLHGRRLHNQRLTGTTFDDPVAVVAWLGAVQSQDYAGAKWGLAQRASGLTDRAVDEAFDQGRILRTHLMRPTWHFVSPADIRWIQSLTARRVHAANGSMYRTLELDAKTLAKSRRIIERALTRSNALTRPQLQEALRRAGIPSQGHRLAYIVMHAELEQLICSGPRRGKQFTYALLERRASRASTLLPDEALFELTRRYFASHGPATVRDFSWWSGLTMKEAREGVESARSLLTSQQVLDRTYWCPAQTSTARARPAAAYLLPNYDECLIAYKDRGSVVERSTGTPLNDFFMHHVLLGDRVAGSWRRTATPTSIEVHVHRPLTNAESRAVAAAVRAYGTFAECAARMVVVSSPTRAGVG